MYTDPTILDFQSYFRRDFPYGTTPDTVEDQDITNAFADASVNINQGMFSTQANYTLGFLLLSAHNLVLNLRASSQGIAGQFSWLSSSKSVGSVSEGISIPQRVLDNPAYAMLSKTNYGAKYFAMLLPNLSGQMFTVQGRTKP